MDFGNEIRGEVDLELEGQRFILRPSYAAIVQIEAATGYALQQLAALADQGILPQSVQTIAVTEMVRAWGRAAEMDEHTAPAERGAIIAARGATPENVAGLLFSFGTLSVQPRLAIAFARALSGGCLPSGEAKPATGMMTTETPAAGSQG